MAQHGSAMYPRHTSNGAKKSFPAITGGTHMKKNLRAAKKRKPVGMRMKHERDPAEVLFEKLGSLKKYKILNTYVLYAIYERPKVTAGGIHLTDKSTEEDEFQGKAGLIVAVGPLVNGGDEATLRGSTLEPGMWIAVRPSDGWAVKVNGTLCRMINEKSVHMVIPTPDSVW